MGIADNRSNKVQELVTPQLEPGEQVVAVLGHGQTGPSPWFSLLTYIIFFWIRYFGVVVTDRRVAFVRKSTWTSRVKDIDAMFPRAQVTLAEWKPSGVWSKLSLNRPDIAGPWRLNVPRIHRAEAEAVAQALGAAAAPPASA